MPDVARSTKPDKFQMFLEMCEVTKTVGGKLPPGLYLVFDAYSYPVIKSIRNGLLGAQTETGIRPAPQVGQPCPTCGAGEHCRFPNPGRCPPVMYLVAGSMNIF